MQKSSSCLSYELLEEPQSKLFNQHTQPQKERIDASIESDTTLLAIDIGGTSIKYGLYTHNQIMKTGAVETPKTWEAFCKVLKEIHQLFITEKLQGVAVSAPGAVDSQAGIIRGISAVNYIHHFDIRSALESLFQLPVTLQNDANCAALAELTYGVAKSVANCAFFVIGTGVGGVVVIERQIVTGAQLCAGEFGLMEVAPGKTLSQLASPVQAAKHFSKKYAEENTSVSAKELVALAKAGNMKARKMLDGVYDSLSSAIYTTLVMLNPEMIVIGGGFSQNPELIEQLTQRIDQRLVQYNISDIKYKLTRCQFLNDANLLGAVVHFKQSSKGEERC